MRSRAWFWRTSILAIVLTILVGLILMHAASINGLSSLQSEVANIRPWMVVARLVALAALIAFWPVLVRRAAEKGYVSTESAQLLQASRWRCLLWLLSLELLIGLHGIQFVTSKLQAFVL